MKKSELKEIIIECIEEATFTKGYAKPIALSTRSAIAHGAAVGVGITALINKLREKRKKIKDPEKRAKQKEIDDKQVEALRRKKEQAKKKRDKND